jgi:riboflavin kinase/FMN adenylyltransferase
MKVWSIDDNLSIRKPVATIGIFDGVHAGHRYILKHLHEQARIHGGDPVVVTLWPHPRIVLGKDPQQFKLLHTLEEKIGELEKAGIGHLVIVPFSEKIASLTACEFTLEYLVERLGVEVLLIGYDNRFGKDRKGDPEKLAQCAEENHFRIEKLPEWKSGPGSVSSTSIRDSILAGRLEEAREMLGYHYFLAGTVMEGNRVGRQIGFPTANLHPTDPNKLIPMNGVYAIRADLRGKTHDGMLNIGYRPTIDSASEVKTIEAHLFGLSDEFYGEQIVIHFVKRIRDEMKFSGIDELKNQLEKDRILVKRLFQSS